MSEFRRQIIISGSAAIVVALIIGIAVVYLPISGPSGTSVFVQNGATLSGGTCSQSFPSGLNVSAISQNKSIAFLMKPDSTAQLCAAYQVQRTNIGAPVTYQLFDFGIVDPNYQCNQTICTGSSTTPNFTMYASPSSFTLFPSNNISAILVDYTIHSGANSQGFHSLGFFNSCQANIPLAVGYSSNQLSASEFQGFFHPVRDCNNPGTLGTLDYLSFGVILGITNLNYTYIKNVNFSAP